MAQNTAQQSATVHYLFDTVPERIEKRRTKIYFIQVGQNGPIKIGYAIDPEKRRAALQTSHSAELRILKTVVGNPSNETDMHLRFWRSHIRGEWFKPTKDLLKFIATAEDFPVAIPKPPRRKRNFTVLSIKGKAARQRAVDALNKKADARY